MQVLACLFAGYIGWAERPMEDFRQALEQGLSLTATNDGSVVREVLTLVLGGDYDDAPETLLSDIGADGIALWAVVAEVERRTESTVKDADVEQCRTIQDLIDLFPG